MLFSEILGQEHLKKHLLQSANNGRLPHAQLFVGPEGSGALAMAIAYAQYVLCGNQGNENTGGKEACNLMFKNFAHPDLHFVFPVTSSEKVSSKPVSNHYMPEWLQFLKEQPYGNLFDWQRSLGVEKKSVIISVEEAKEISKTMSLKAYEGGYKVLIIWMAERMNIPCSNKLLKLIEEPQDKTLIILVAEDEEQLLGTIRSRCQELHFPAIAEGIIKDKIQERGIDEALAFKIAHQAAGNYNKALNLAENDSEESLFEAWFVQWVRSAFKAKGNKKVIQDLVIWSDTIAKTNRETQQQFLEYCIEVFRQALMLNYGANDLAFMELNVEGFKLEKFAPFVHNENILDITKELQDAIYHINRNGNGKVILTDLSIKLTRLLHKKTA
jgi:DNA polymerase-3 subunit delta'